MTHNASSPFFKSFQPLMPLRPALRKPKSSPHKIVHISQKQYDNTNLANDWQLVEEDEIEKEELNLQNNINDFNSSQKNPSVDDYLNELTKDVVNLDNLKSLCVGGIPSQVRTPAWLLLLGYWSLDSSKRVEQLQSYRQQYHDYVMNLLIAHNPLQYSTQQKEEEKEEKEEEENKNKKDNQKISTTLINLNHEQQQQQQKEQEEFYITLMKQIQVDIPRTSTDGFKQVFSHPKIQRLMENVLYIWAINHPSVNYFQGLNDLCCPFIVLLLSSYVGGELELVDAELIDKLSIEVMRTIEADTYWCVTFFLTDVQDNFVVNNVGINNMIYQFEFLVSLVNPSLYNHLKKLGVDFVYFAVRWVICLLTRELSLRNTVRLWDTYLSANGSSSSSNDNMIYQSGRCNAQFHLCVCTALLCSFSETIQSRFRSNEDFSHALLFLQHLKNETIHWDDDDIRQLVMKAYEVADKNNIYHMLVLAVCGIILVLLLITCIVISLLILHQEQQKEKKNKNENKNKK